MAMLLSSTMKPKMTFYQSSAIGLAAIFVLALFYKNLLVDIIHYALKHIQTKA